MQSQGSFEAQQQEDQKQREAAAYVGLALLDNLGPDRVREVLQTHDPTLSKTTVDAYLAHAGKLLDRYHKFLKEQQAAGPSA